MKGKSGDGKKKAVKWEFFDQLAFLKPYINGNDR